MLAFIELNTSRLSLIPHMYPLLSALLAGLCKFITLFIEALKARQLADYSTSLE
jgi:hypothetical protein